MSILSVQNIHIAGIAACVPKNRQLNLDLPLLSEREKDALIKKVGIEERRIAPRDMSASDLCFESAKQLMAQLSWKPEDVDFLIFVSQTPDYQIPGSGPILQDRLNLPRTCTTFDINQGCSGYVYGLATIASLMSTSPGAKGLLLVGDTISHLIDERDMGLIPIFSDAGSCTALEYSLGAAPQHYSLMTDGSRYDAIMVPGNNPKRRKEHLEGRLTMNGHEVFKFGLEEIVPNIKGLLKATNYEKDSIDYFIMHQANRLLNEAIRKKLNFSLASTPYSLLKFGNTSCATIPITLVSQINRELEQKTHNLLLSGFGVGLSWGSALLSVTDFICPDLLEL